MTVTIERLDVASYEIPTEQPESDGTLQWDSTTLVVVHAHGGGRTGVGYTYSSAAAAKVIEEKLVDAVVGHDLMRITEHWMAMQRAVRNLGRVGITAMAIAAVDNALWDLEARVLDVPLTSLLGQHTDAVPIYGSGGFTSYDDRQLAAQLAGWAEQDIPRVKMKVGREPGRDPDRVAVARQAIGDDVELFVDANGAYGRQQAVQLGHVFAFELGVKWYEEPRPSDDVAGLRFVREHGPFGLEVTAGEYGWTLPDFHGLLAGGAVDVLQADVTRCGGISGFLEVAALCDAMHVPLSAHCAPAQSVHVCAAVRPMRHIEYFHDHVRIEGMLFDGTLPPRDGALWPDLDRPGNGLTFKAADAERYRVA